MAIRKNKYRLLNSIKFAHCANLNKITSINKSETSFEFIQNILNNINYIKSILRKYANIGVFVLKKVCDVADFEKLVYKFSILARI